MTVRKMTWAWLAAVVVILAWAGPAAAQCNSRQELERAAELIDRARDEVARSPVAEAKELLRAAESRLRQGGDQAARGNHDNACKLARVAQELALKAADVARRGNRVVAELENILARSDDLIADTAGRVGRGGPPEAERILKLAFKQQDQAKRAFRTDRLRLALKLTLMARDTATRALRLTQGRPAEDAGFIGRSLDETDRLIAEAARVAGEGAGGRPDHAEDLLARARRLQAEGRRHLAGGRPALALQLTRQARLFAIRALDQVDVDLDAADVEGMVEITGELLDRLAEAAVESGDTGARDLLRRAQRLLDDGRASLAKGDVREALGSARAASALALDVAERLGARPQP